MNCIPRKGPGLNVMRLQPRWLLLLLLLFPLILPAQQLVPSPAASRDVLLIDEMICRGNVATSCDFILGHIYLSPGDSVDENELGNARLRLSSLPSFESINIYLERGTARGHVRIVVEVVEADPHVREWLAGTSLRSGDARQLLSARLTHQNLFGTGKLMDALLFASVPIDAFPRHEYGGRVQYVDPHWLDIKRMYFIAGLSALRSSSETRDNQFKFESTSYSADVAIGRRLFDFSFLSLTYRYSDLADFRVSSRSDAVRNLPPIIGPTDSHAVSAVYGWNSEDDPYFPTRGSRASVLATWTLDATDLMTGGGIRKTWTTENGTSWILQVEDTPATEYRTAFPNEHFKYFGGFARPINAGDEIQRGRWYVEAGYSPAQFNRWHERQIEYGLKVGVRLKTRTFGFVDLYVIGSVVTDYRGLW